MPNTYGGAISQGISQGLGNVGAIYGLQNQMRKSGQEQELYDIQMKEYRKGLEPADWGKIGNFLDAGEEGAGYAKAYAGALGKDPDKMTRKDMREFGEIFLKDQKAAHDILQFRRRHYGQKVKEYEGKPGLEAELNMFRDKLDQATMLDKSYREVQAFKQEQEMIQKTAQAMQKVANMTDDELTAKGYPPIMRDMAMSGDVQGFRSIAGKIAEAQVKPPTDFERYTKMTPEERKEYDKFKGAGKEGKDKAYKMQIADLVTQYGISEQDATGIIVGTKKVQPDPVSGTLYLTDIIKGTQRPLTDTGLSSATTPTATGKSPTIWDLSSESTGPISAALTAGSIATGVVGLPVAEKTLYARQYVQGAQNDLIRSLSINPRFPVGEINRLKEEINLAPTFFDNPKMLRQRILAINAYLRKRVQNETAASQNSTLSTEARRNARSAANDILNFLEILGAPPLGNSVSTDDAALINKYLKR